MRVLCLLLLLAAAPASAQTVRLHVLTDSVTVGERFGVAVAVDHGPAVQVLFPDPPTPAAAIEAPLTAGEAELLGVQRFPPTVRGGTRTDSAVYEAAAFALDSARVGPVEVRLVRGGDTTAVASGVVFVGVRSLVPAAAEEPMGLLPLATFPRPWWPWLAGALAVLALLLALWLWRRRRQRRGAPEGPPRSPYEEARSALEALAAAAPERPDAVKPYYVALSDALRTYLARSLRLPARELTTRELLAALARRPDTVPAEARAHLHTVLRQADLVKFAAVHPAPEAHRTALEQARAAVEQIETALHPPEPEEAEP